MNNEACRKAFETWAVTQEISIKRCEEIPSIYDEELTNTAWHGFQAAYNLRPVLSVVQIRSLLDDHLFTLCGEHNLQGVDDAAQAIFDAQDKL